MGVVIKHESDSLLKQLTHSNAEQQKEIAFLREQIMFLNQLVSKH